MLLARYLYVAVVSVGKHGVCGNIQRFIIIFSLFCERV
jgi:hypothetical protein